MGGTGNLPSFIGYGGHEMNQNLILPQIAVGQHYKTSILLLNMGNMSQMSWMTAQSLKTTGKIYFYGQDGQPLPVSINAASPVSAYAFSLDAAQISNLEVTFPGDDTSGWALIAVDDLPGAASWGMMNGLQMSRGARIMATVFYTYSDGSQASSRVGVIPSMYEMGLFKTSLVAVQSSDNLYCGVAVVNTNAHDASVQLKLEDAEGNVVDTAQLPLSAGHQIAKFTSQLFGTTLPAGAQGYIEIGAADDGIVALGLLVSDGIMTSIPVMHYGPITH